MEKKKVAFGVSMPLVLCLMLVVSMFAASSVAFGESTVAETRDFNVNLFDYDQIKILEMLEDEFNDASKGIDPEYDRMFMFMGGRDGDGNRVGEPGNRAWFSNFENDNHIYQNLVNDELDSKGRPEYTAGILGIDLFDPGERSRYDAYKDIPFEFNYNPDTKIYSYSSKKNSALFDGSRVSLGAPLGGGADVNGFRPFGSSPKSNLDHFGLSMEVEFYIPESGPEGLRFNFSGDDDVWVFIDDELVLDLGGIHGDMSGTVSFTEDKAVGTLQSGAKVFIYDNGSKADGGSGIIESYGTFEPGTVHKLKFFYLERGGNAANCHIEFNIPPTVADFAFTKADKGTESKLPGAVFRLYGEDSEGTGVDKTAESNEEGIIRFQGLSIGEYELVEQKAPKGYKISNEAYLIKVSKHQPVFPMALEGYEEFGLIVWYAPKPEEGDEPDWMKITGSGSLWIWNEKLPPEEQRILTIKKTVTGNLAPADAEYEFMVQFFNIQGDDVSTCAIKNNESESGIIKNLTEIDCKLQEDGDYTGYYRFVLKNGQQIAFDYENYFDEGPVGPMSAGFYQSDLQFRLIETGDNSAASVAIAAGGQFGAETPSPLIEGKQIKGTLAGDSVGTEIVFTNAFGNKNKDKDKDKDTDKDKDMDKDKDTDKSNNNDVPKHEDHGTVISEEVIVQPTPVIPALPKTGGTGSALFIVLGSLLTGIGAFMRRS